MVLTDEGVEIMEIFISKAKHLSLSLNLNTKKLQMFLIKAKLWKSWKSF